MTERGSRNLGERGTQAARGLDRIARGSRELDTVRSRQMAELVYDSTLLPRNEEQYQAECLDHIRSSPHATVEDDLSSATHRFSHGRQSVQGGGRIVGG